MQPLVLLIYERLMPGSQLVNRLQDAGYRVRTVDNPQLLADQASREKPLFILADAYSRHDLICKAIASLKKTPATSHIPVIAIAAPADAELQAVARAAGATLVVSEAAAQLHLKEIVEQALLLD